MKRSLLYLLSVILLMTSCEQNLDDAYEYEAIKSELEVGVASLAFTAEAQSQRIQIKCNSYWMVTVPSSASWLSLNAYEGKGNGSLIIGASANTSVTSSRSGVITISDGIKTASIKVTQEPSDEYLSANSTSLNFTYEGGTSYVAINSNVNWTATSNANWVTVSKSNTSTQLIVRTAENLSSYSSRKSTITVKGDTQTILISVTQKGPSVPSVYSLSVSSITSTSAICTFSYDSSNIRIEQCGVCYSSTNKQPTLDDNKVYTSFSSYSWTPSFSLSGLTYNTTYYVCPYVTTSIGTTYGTVVSFTTANINSPNEDDNPTPNY